jgi:PEP-CTERM motif
MWIKSSLLAILFLAGAGAQAMAAPTYDSLTSGAGTAASFNTESYAVAFSLSSPGGLSEIELELQRANAAGDSSGSVVITLNANDNGEPGSLINTLATIDDTSLAASVASIVDITGLGVTGLSSDTTYWIEIAKGGTSTTRIEPYTDKNAPLISNGPDLEATETTGSFSATSTPPEIALCISGDDSCASTTDLPITLSINEAPEPASLAIFGSGLLSIGWVRRRRRNKF